MKNETIRYPSPEEMNELIRAAHRARSREMGRLVRTGLRRLKLIVVRLGAEPAGKRVSHA
jgi:hypothetical protein